jgi:catechol 2,3-dioxygenase-like lactoylglutathione lyase family enzyme
MTTGDAGAQSGFLAQLGILGVDHVAVTTRHFDQTVADYLSLPGTRIERGPGWNPTQRVDFAFVSLGSGLTVEVLGLRPDVDSPIEEHVRRGGGAYHLCYIVQDIDAALARVKEARGKLVVPPTPDVAFNGRRIAFFMHRAHGLVELVEAATAAGPPVRGDEYLSKAS